MKTETFLHELEALCEQAGYRIRKERGSFRGDACVIEGDKLILVNRNRPAEAQAATLASVLREVGVEDIYVKPAVRKKMVELWDRLDLSDDKSEESVNGEP